MQATQPSNLIPVSGRAFVQTGRSQAFADWLCYRAVSSSSIRCEGIATAAVSALDVLTAAAPVVVPHNLPAAEAFIQQANLPLLGVPSQAQADLIIAVRGLHAWVHGLDGPTARALMARGSDEHSSVGDDSNVIRVPGNGGETSRPAAREAAVRHGSRKVSACIPDGVKRGRVELPLSYSFFEAAVARELARRAAADEPADVRPAAKAVLVEHAPSTRRRLALTAATACAVPSTAFVRAGALSNLACDAFLLELVEARHRAGQVATRSA